MLECRFESTQMSGTETSSKNRASKKKIKTGLCWNTVYNPQKLHPLILKHVTVMFTWQLETQIHPSCEKKSGMDCAGEGLIAVIIYFKIQSHFRSGYLHSSSAVMAKSFGLQRQVNKKWSVRVSNYEDAVVEQSRHYRVQKRFNFQGCELGTLFFRTVGVCSASCVWFKMFTLSKPRAQYS